MKQNSGDSNPTTTQINQNKYLPGNGSNTTGQVLDLNSYRIKKELREIGFQALGNEKEGFRVLIRLNNGQQG